MNGYIKKIEQINFGLMSPDDIREMSVVTVETPDTYEDDGLGTVKDTLVVLNSQDLLSTLVLVM